MKYLHTGDFTWAIPSTKDVGIVLCVMCLNLKDVIIALPVIDVF